MGKLFFIGMMCSSLISIPISWMPNHTNLFLFLIGLFTIYLILSGTRALKFKNKEKADSVDFVISWTMVSFSFVMIALGFFDIIQSVNSGILYLFFGGFGLFLSLSDIQFLKSPRGKKNAWLISHVRKMNGALIASITAFLVAGLGINNLIAWTLPSILGTFYIVYWRRKIQKKTVSKV